MKKGTKIIYNGKMGGFSGEDEMRFTGHTEEGQEGVYIRPLMNPHNWHMTKTLTEPPLFVPVHTSHFHAKP